MSDEPALTFPTPREIAARNERHIRRLHPRLRPLARELIRAAAALGIMLVITESFRSLAVQAGYFARGRRLVDGKWIIVDAKAVVTRAETAEDTAHGRGAGVDVAVLIEGRIVGPRPGPGNDSYDRGLTVDGRNVWLTIAELAEGLALVAGAFFPPVEADGLGWDLGHVELPRWRSLPYPATYDGAA